MRAANSDRGDGDSDVHILPLLLRDEAAHEAERPFEYPGGKCVLPGATRRLEILVHDEFSIRPQGETGLVRELDLQDRSVARADALSREHLVSLRQLPHGAVRRLRAAHLAAGHPRDAPDGG